MPNSPLFEYAVIRFVPRVEREEFLNVGVILFCKSLNFLDTRCSLDEKKLCFFKDDQIVDEFKTYLATFEKIARGEAHSGSIAEMDKASRFRWLSATRSTILQTSRVHPGFCDNPEEMLERLFQQLVL